MNDDRMISDVFVPLIARTPRIGEQNKIKVKNPPHHYTNTYRVIPPKPTESLLPACRQMAPKRAAQANNKQGWFERTRCSNTNKSTFSSSRGERHLVALDAKLQQIDAILLDKVHVVFGIRLGTQISAFNQRWSRRTTSKHRA